MGTLASVRRTRLVTLAIWVAFLAMAIQTRHQAQVWQSDLTLWRNAAAVSPSSLRALMNWGVAAMQAGDFTTARTALERTVVGAQDARQSAYDRAFYAAAAETNLAVLDLAVGDRARGRHRLDTVLQAFPHFQPAQDVSATWSVIPDPPSQ